jgi:hypothetical protein
MGYVIYRDNPELEGVSEDDRVRISLLADDLEQVSQQNQHEDRCACNEGRKQHWKCIYGPVFPSVDADEILALAFARGLLKLPE